MSNASRTRTSPSAESAPTNLFDLSLNQGVSLPQDISNVKQILEAQGLNQEIARTLNRSITEFLDRDQSLDRLVANALEPIVSFDARMPLHRKAVALVGEPGSGKTTAIAKLASRLQAALEMRIGLIAVEGFGQASSRQLPTYAALLNIPCKVLDPNRSVIQEMSKAFRAFRDYDLVLIDTFDCPASDARRLEWLRQALGDFEEIEPILVLPAPATDKELTRAARSFERLGYERLIVSKLDQSGLIGPLVNTAVQFGKALAFLSTGARIPEDIEPATSRRLAWMLSRSLH